MPEKTLVALYDDFAAATRAVRALEESGIDRHQIGLVASNAEGRETGAVVGSAGGDTATAAPEAAGTGAALGAVLGGGASLLAAAGALAIPGIGPVLAAGPLAAALAGAGLGAAAGGLVGGLVGLGVPEDEARHYAEGVRRGGAVVTVHLHDDHAAAQAIRILEDHDPTNLDQRTGAWRQEGWTGFDEKAEGWPAGRIAQERAHGGVRPDDGAAAISSGATGGSGLRKAIREVREAGTIEAAADAAEMEGGPQPSAMSGMFGSAGAGARESAAGPGAEDTRPGAADLQPQDEPLKRHADPARGPVRSYPAGGDAVDRAAAGDKPQRIEGADPLAGHSRNRG